MVEACRTLALALTGTAEAIACVGTALEKRTVNVRKKTFLFLGANDVMLKLREALPEATALAAAEPGRYKVGAHGWVTAGADAPPDVLERWITESWRLCGGR